MPCYRMKAMTNAMILWDACMQVIQRAFQAAIILFPNTFQMGMEG
jgi:hypothetical protein